MKSPPSVDLVLLGKDRIGSADISPSRAERSPLRNSTVRIAALSS
jgi:hypothetical protein